MNRFITLFSVSVSLVGCGQFGPEGVEINDTGDQVVDTDVIDTQDDTEDTEPTDTQVEPEPECPNVDVDFYADGSAICDFSWMDRFVLRVDATNPNVLISKDLIVSQYTNENFMVPVGDLWSDEWPVWDPENGSGYDSASFWHLDGTIAVVPAHPDGDHVEVMDLWDYVGIYSELVVNPFPTPGVPDVAFCIQRPGGAGAVYEGDHDECQRQMIEADLNALDEEPETGSPVTCFHDWDEDGYGEGESFESDGSCPDGSVTNNMDCYGTNGDIFPGAVEIDDELDNDCDGLTDEGFTATATDWFRDSDGDTYGDPNSKTSSITQPTGYVADKTDCDDGRNSSHPGATEVTDLRDNDCDGLIDENASTGRVTATWSFKLDATAAGLTLDQFEVKNTTAGTVVTAFNKTGDTITVSVASQKDDVLSIQCWLAGNTDWCASNLHSGHILSATGPTGAYTVGQTSGDLHYVIDGSGQRYGGAVK